MYADVSSEQTSQHSTGDDKRSAQMVEMEACRALLLFEVENPLKMRNLGIRSGDSQSPNMDTAPRKFERSSGYHPTQ